uniref:PGC-1 and ERR-induced regulator in muscle protein 1 n=2 Tax=Sphaeramia orbicularis TaxID=375764 RepID=A0A672ZZ10_9TELE
MGENLFPCSEMNQIGNGEIQTNPNFSESEDLSVCLPNNSLISSCYSLETQSLESLSNENSKDALGSPCSSLSPSDTRCEEKKSQILTTADKREETSQDKGQDVSYVTEESNCDLANEVEVSTVRSQVENEPVDSKCSVFAMSSFWREMEKLTINDILGLRVINNNPPSSLPPLLETENTDLVMMDSGCFCQVDESNLGQTSMEASIVSDPVDSNLSSVIAVDASSSKSVMWESEPVSVSLPVGIYPSSMTLTAASDISQPVLSDGTQKSLRKISKNVSVHNLRALESESFSHKYEGQTSQILEEEECANLEYVTDKHVPKQDLNSLPSVSAESYRISLTDIFQYLFGGKQSNPSQPPTDSINSSFTDGNSVPETYDHFFSEFDTDTFFYPLITATDEAKDELVPIFSYSRSANRNLQFPEAYDYFFVSSSSDDSSDEEDKNDHRPVRVVTRLSRKASASKISTDVYDNFFTDSDLKEDFFWPKSFSFRNIQLTGRAIQRRNSNSLPLPVMQKPQSLRRTLTPISALGNQDFVPDPLLYHLEERIFKQLQQQPFRYEDLQTAVANPRLDSSFLPLRHSDMCLVCIAFASWVLKTANPQDGDTWKAVLLANVSALSAIRYLRKYVKVEAAVSDNKTNHAANV